jgi:hypothetical protein
MQLIRKLKEEVVEIKLDFRETFLEPPVSEQ